MLLGGLIGLEREMADKPAGLCTQMLVAGAASLLVGLGDALLTRFNITDATNPKKKIRVSSGGGRPQNSSILNCFEGVLQFSHPPRFGPAQNSSILNCFEGARRPN